MYISEIFRTYEKISILNSLKALRTNKYRSAGIIGLTCMIKYSLITLCLTVQLVPELYLLAD